MGNVRIGQVWDFVGEATDAPPHARGWRCVVVAKNDSREAGPDSWVMHCTDNRRTLYMHRRQLNTGSWRRVSAWQRLCDWIWAGEPFRGRFPAALSSSQSGEKP